MEFINWLANNYVVLFELIGLLIILFISSHVSNKIKLLTRISIGLLFATIVATEFEAWTQTFEKLSLWRPILTAAKYSLYSLIIYFVILLVSEIAHPFSTKIKWIILAPHLIAIPLYFTSQWTHLIFFFNEDNVFARGPLTYLPYITFFVYYAIFLAINLFYLKNYSRRDRIVLLYIAVVSVLCVVLLFSINKTEEYTSIFTSSLLLYFLFIYINMANIDPLTGLLNRNSYYQFLRLETRKITAVVSIDMNDLKYLNDTYGHDEGDKALKAISKIIKENAGKHSSCYRIGGDEFIVFYLYENEEEVIEHINKMKEELSKTKYTCAFGYSIKRIDNDVQSMIKDADKEMYNDKEKYKAAQK